MATPLDVSFLGTFTPIFVFLLIFSLLYSLLIKTKFFGDNKNYLTVIAIATALLFLMNSQAQGVVALFTPWFILFVFLLLFIFLFFIFLGVKHEDIGNLFHKPGYISIVVAGTLLLFLIALTKVYGPFLMVNNAPGFWPMTKRLLFNPRILGVVFLLAVAAYTINYIVAPEK